MLGCGFGGHMSVEPSENEVWTRWQGHVVNDVFPLGRFLGCSDHSAVFLTESSALGPAEAAIKLVPADRALAESQLPRWKRAGRIAHPHLLKLLQWGGCQLDGVPFLYVVMEYADQTLAQVLQHRALTDDEAREMLRPTLDALAYLHAQSLVQGQLRPTNFLSVGDELKLATDTIRRVSDGTLSASAPTAYDPPESGSGNSSTAGDVWALGVCLFEALTRRSPSGSPGRGEAVALPDDFSPAFRDVVTRCLDPRPQKRPSVTELIAWASGGTAGFAADATVQPAAIVPPEPTTPEPPAPSRIAPPPAPPEATQPAPFVATSRNPRALLAAVLGAVVILALGWAGLRMAGSNRTPAPPTASVSSLPQTAGAAAPSAPASREPASKPSPPKPGRSSASTPQPALIEVIPDVPQSARRTITGHINVWVRVIVDQDGSVFAATTDKSGPSRYFQQLALDAARKWTFPPVDAQPRRVMEIRFDFSRDGTTGRAIALQ